MEPESVDTDVGRRGNLYHHQIHRVFPTGSAVLCLLGAMVFMQEVHGPAITYVTDEDLDRLEHERVLREFIACAGVQPLRVAFRLPAWNDSEFVSLLEWYLKAAESAEPGKYLERPLVHDRPQLTDQVTDTLLWLPWRNRNLAQPHDVGRLAISIHSVDDAHEAVSVGASELIFGHVFTSESHPGEQGRGVPALIEVEQAMQVYQNPPRVVGIGGIDERTIPEIGRRKLCNVATMRTISRSSNIAGTLDRMRAEWVAASINADLHESQRSPLGNPSSIFF